MQPLAAMPPTPSRSSPAAAARARRATATVADPRWAALRARDAGADDRFLYAVSTTGVYCRPSCAARTPRPEHVDFFADRAGAEAAGYRPCQRCRPDLPPRPEREAAQAAALCRLLDADRGDDVAPTVEQLAAALGLSRAHTHRLFKRATGITPRAWAAGRRAERARVALASAPTVTAAVYDAGYASSSRFYADADDRLGMRPRALRAGAAGETITHAVAPCSLGRVLVAATGRGVCAILLDDDDAALRADLRRRFPRATLVDASTSTDADAAFAAVVAAVVALVDAPARTPALPLPLDLRGTAFQERVWQALRQVPAGTTVTYAELARAIGAEHAVRAVAGACAANPLAVAVPCHRVVRQGGALSGYRWGVARKQRLLEREGAR